MSCHICFASHNDRFASFYILKLYLIPAFQVVDAVVKGQKWLIMLQPKP
jgi:hypothetical protein